MAELCCHAVQWVVVRVFVSGRAPYNTQVDRIIICMHGVMELYITQASRCHGYCLPPPVVHRCMFASNFPVDRVNVSFSKLMEVQHAVVNGYTQDEQAHYFGGLARRIYRLD